MNALEFRFFKQLELISGNWKAFPEPSHDYVFHPHREYEIDLAWADKKVGVEVQGGVWAGTCAVCKGNGVRGLRTKPGMRLVTCRACNGTGKSEGAHGRPQGIERDCEKMCLAASMGWIIMPVTSKMIGNGNQISIAAKWVAEALSNAKEAKKQANKVNT